MAEENRNERLKKMLEDRRREVESYTPAISGVSEALDLEFEAMREDALERIKRALWHLEKGSYGVCSGCHREISEERLRGLPFVALCQRCDDQAELEGALRAIRARKITFGELFSN